MKASAFFALGAAAVLCVTSLAKADDPGYFLSWQQKKDLLSLGRMQDSAGNWYDVWICPGYVPPARYAREHLREAGADFHEYIEADKYRSLKGGSKACFTWALDECGLGFTVKGIPRAWGRHFGVANERTRRRVFGWWMAYPWAFMESSVETAFRGVLGSLGTVGGIATGAAVVPAYHALDSAVSGVWNLGVNTIIIPVAGVGWNTVVGPPLALIGQKPSVSRVDGFWVTVVGSDAPSAALALSQEEVDLLGRWGLLLLKETQPLAQKQTELDRSAADRERELLREMQTIRAEQSRKRSELRDQESALIQKVASTNELSSALLSRHPPLVYRRGCEADVRRYLKEQNVSREDAERVVRLLNACEATRAAIPSPPRQKTDPLQRSVEVLGESAADTLK